MNDLTTDELATLISVFERAGSAEHSDAQSAEASLFEQIKTLHAERVELESLDFDDCVGGACKL